MSLVFGTLAAIMIVLGWGVPPVGADQKPSAPAALIGKPSFDPAESSSS
jgi:hypothetical protein